MRATDSMQKSETTLALPASVADIPFRPTIGMELYKSKKAARANLAPGGAGRPSAGNAPQLLAPTTGFQNFSALNQTDSGGLRPPDPHAAVGTSHVCQVVNTRIACFNKAAPNTRVLPLSLASFFGYTLQTIFDPRIVYDGTWLAGWSVVKRFPSRAPCSASSWRFRRPIARWVAGTSKEGC